MIVCMYIYFSVCVPVTVRVCTCMYVWLRVCTSARARVRVCVCVGGWGCVGKNWQTNRQIKRSSGSNANSLTETQAGR